MALTITKDEAQPLASDNAAAQRVIRQARKTYIAGMSFVWSGVTCAYLPFMVPFSDNAAYVALFSGAAFSLLGATCMAIRLHTIVALGQDRENLFCRSIYSYDRQLRKANSRAAEANRLADRRRRIEGAADGDNGEIKCSPSAWRVN